MYAADPPLGVRMPLPLNDIKKVLIDAGELSKDEIRAIWGLSEEEYEELKLALATERLITSGPRGKGDFAVHVRKRPLPAPPEAASELRLESDWENIAVERLAALFSHAELERLLGDLVYTVRRARTQLTGEDRRGTKRELAAALVIQHSIDLFAKREIRNAVAKKCRVEAPGRWHPGKGVAPRFVADVCFPKEFAGIPSPETPPDFEYLEGRVTLASLEDFQREVQQQLFEVLGRPKGRAIVTLPTGGGKTRVAVDTIRDWITGRWENRRAHPRGHTVLWLAHTEELCEQAYLCFRQVWQASSNVSPLQLFRFWGRYTQDFERHRENLLAMRERPSCLVTTPHRMARLLAREQDTHAAGAVVGELLTTTQLILIDEAHRAAAPSYRQVLDAFSAADSDACVVGLTATPFRAEYLHGDETAGTRELKSIFRRIIEPQKTLGEEPRKVMQERGYLARPQWDAIETNTLLKSPPLDDPMNITEDDIEKIDFALKKRADNPARRLRILEYILPICEHPEAKVIYFGPSVLDAECMAFLLRLRGISSAFVSGDTREVTRRKIVDDFKHGDIRVLCNCEVLTTGFDAPKVTHLVMARPTVSQVLYEQMVGRGLRGERFGGTKTCVVIDCDDKYRERRPILGYQAFREIWKPRRVRTIAESQSARRAGDAVRGEIL